MQSRALLLAAMIAAVATGCTKTHVAENRITETGITPGERITIVLEQHKDCTFAQQCEVSSPQESRERSFAFCIAGGMRSVKPDLAFVSAGDFRRAAFPGMAGDEMPRSHQALFASMANSHFAVRVSALNLRYLIVLDTHTELGSKKLVLEGREVWGIGSEWTRSSIINANIIDLKHKRLAGHLSASSHGKSGFVVPVVYIFPLLPIPFSAPTESQACHAMGEKIATFLLQAASQ